ncbi:MAG: hypothetical protein ABEK50_08560 [bacterium]
MFLVRIFGYLIAGVAVLTPVLYLFVHFSWSRFSDVIKRPFTVWFKGSGVSTEQIEPGMTLYDGCHYARVIEVSNHALTLTIPVSVQEFTAWRNNGAEYEGGVLQDRDGIRYEIVEEIGDAIILEATFARRDIEKSTRTVPDSPDTPFKNTRS